jgi:hypothetical protein
MLIPSVDFDSLFWEKLANSILKCKKHICRVAANRIISKHVAHIYNVYHIYPVFMAWPGRNWKKVKKMP